MDDHSAIRMLHGRRSATIVPPRITMWMRARSAMTNRSSSGLPSTNSRSANFPVSMLPSEVEHLATRPHIPLSRGVCVALMASQALRILSPLAATASGESGRFLRLWQIGTQGREFLDEEILRIRLLYGETD